MCDHLNFAIWHCLHHQWCAMWMELSNADIIGFNTRDIRILCEDEVVKTSQTLLPEDAKELLNQVLASVLLMGDILRIEKIYTLRAQRFLQMEKPHQALFELQHIKNPNVKILSLIYNCYDKMQEQEHMIETLEVAIHLEPHNLELIEMRARLL